MMHGTRLISAAATMALAATTLVIAAAPASADPAHCSGWNNHPDRYSAGGISFANGTALRRGPYTDCDALGRAYPSHGIDVHCQVLNSNGVRWAFVRDTTTGVNGWVSQNAIQGGGPVPMC